MPPGRYHAWCDGVKNVVHGGGPALRFRLVILAGTVPDMAGRVHVETVGMAGNSDRLHFLAWRLGLISEQLLDRELVTVNWANVVGAQFIIQLDEVQFLGATGKPRMCSRLPWDGVWALDDPRVADVPRSDEVFPFDRAGGEAE